MSLRSPCVTHLRPPTSPLFPYTTLFRSLHACRDLDLAIDLGLSQHLGVAVQRGQQLPVAQRDVDARDGAQRLGGGTEHRDRKSTRLNSSHANTSYAVFCLKQKNTLPRMR